jgi:hypothetical protein
MKIKNSGVLLLSAFIVLLGVSCASVRVYRLESEGGGKEKVDESVEGIPYYMPRPYLEVYDPFVVDAKPYFVKARLTSDGKYLQLESLPSELSAENLDGIIENVIPKIVVPKKAPVKSAGSNKSALQGKTAGGSSSTKPDNTSSTSTSDLTNGAGDTSTSPNKPSSPSTNATPSTAGLGSTKVSSTGDFYITPGRRFFDIVYLPDYSDKRIIQIRTGLGKTDVSVTLAQGWALAGLNAQVDNTELAKRLLETYDTGLQLAQKVATATLFPPAGALQGAIAPKAVQAGEEVTCKLIVTTMVAPGLYPLPKEVDYPTAYPEIDRSGFSLVKHLGLNTYKVYVVEALRPSGDSPLNFTGYSNPPAQSKTGNPSVTVPEPRSMTVIQNAVKKYLETNGYKGKIVAVQAAAGANVDEVSLTIEMQPDQVPSATDKLNSLENDLKSLAQAAVKPMKLTVVKVDAKPTSTK